MEPCLIAGLILQHVWWLPWRRSSLRSPLRLASYRGAMSLRPQSIQRCKLPLPILSPAEKNCCAICGTYPAGCRPVGNSCGRQSASSRRAGSRGMNDSLGQMARGPSKPSQYARRRSRTASKITDRTTHAVAWMERSQHEAKSLGPSTKHALLGRSAAPTWQQASCGERSKQATRLVGGR